MSLPEVLDLTFHQFHYLEDQIEYIQGQVNPKPAPDKPIRR